MKRGVGSEWPAETLTSTTPALTLSMDDAGEPMASLAGGLLIPPIIPEIDDNLEIDTTGLSGLSLLTEVLLDPDANATNATLNSNSSTTSLLPAFGHSIPHILSPLEIPDLPHISPFGDGDGEPGEKDDGGMAETVAPETSGAPIALEAAEGPDTPQQEHDTVEMEQMEQIGETSQTIPVEIPPELQAEAKPGDIAAYFALEFLDMQYIYYLQRSTVSLGRGAIPGATGQESSSSSSADIDLGPLKNISRLHARIEYEEESERFVLVVIGRNGVFVDGVWIEPGRRVPLCDRTLIQISTRAFYFLLPTHTQGRNSNEGDNEQDAVPSLDSTVTTAEDEDEAEEDLEGEVDDEDGDAASLDHTQSQRSLSPSITPKQNWSIGGKGKGKSILAMGPPKRKRGRPPKSATLAAAAAKPPPYVTYPKPRIVTSPRRGRRSSFNRYGEEDITDAAMQDAPPDHDQDLDLDESDEDEDDYGDDGGEFIPRGGRGKRMRIGGLGKTKPPKGRQPAAYIAISVKTKDKSKDVKDEDMSDDNQLGDDAGTDDALDGENEDAEGEEATLSAKRPAKRKREAVDGDADLDARAHKKKRLDKVKIEGDAGKKSLTKSKGGRRKGASALPMKSLFTTTELDLERGGKDKSATAADGTAESKGKVKAEKKSKGKKDKDKGKGKEVKELDQEAKDGDDLEDDEDGDKVKKEGKEDGDEEKDAKEKAPSPPPGPPPQKPPFTYPLLCYRALKSLNGKASYRAITKWLESEYPYFAMASKEGKDGWENSTRHTLSSHRAFIKIDRKPEERGKGCFWSFDPEFEIQFADQWQAALSNSRNPRAAAPRPPPAQGPAQGPHPPGAPPRPPYPPFPWTGVTPPHLMPGYRPMPPGANGPGGPFPYGPLGRPGMPPAGPGPHPPLPNGMHPSHPHPPHPPHPGFPNGPPHGPFPPPPPHAAVGASNMPPAKARAPKKPKQALGAAFSRAPLIRPGLGGIPATGSNGSNGAGGSGSGNATSTNNGISGKPPAGKEMDGIRIHGERLAAMSARIAKDEMSGRAPPGTALNAALGCLPPPPPPSAFANGARPPPPILPPRPPASTKIPFVLAAPPQDALPPIPPPLSSGKTTSSGAKESQLDSESKDSEKTAEDTGDSEAPEDAPSSSAANPTSNSTPNATSSTKSQPPRPIMPMVMHKGTLYLHPRAFPHLTAEDVKKMNELNVADAMTYLMGRNVVLGAPPSLHPLHPSQPGPNAGGKGATASVTATAAKTGNAESTSEAPKETTPGSDEDEEDEETKMET